MRYSPDIECLLLRSKELVVIQNFVESLKPRHFEGDHVLSQHPVPNLKSLDITSQSRKVPSDEQAEAHHIIVQEALSKWVTLGGRKLDSLFLNEWTVQRGLESWMEFAEEVHVLQDPKRVETLASASSV